VVRFGGDQYCPAIWIAARFCLALFGWRVT
jgi:hypothetical protein